MKLTLDGGLDWPRLQSSAEPMSLVGSAAGTDPIEAMAQADRADWALMRLVLCAATATLLLAVAGSLQI